MPEYFPAPNLSAAAALAEQANQMRSQQPSPWAALLQSFAPSVAQYGENVAKRQQSTVTPQMLQALGVNLQPVTRPMPPGQVGPPQSSPGASAFPGGRIPMTLVEQMQHNRELTLLQQLRGQQGEIKGHFQVTQDQLDANPAWKKQGIPVGSWLPDAMRTNAAKPQSININGLSDQENGALQKALDSGQLAPDRLNMRPQSLKALAKEFIKNPAYDATKAEAGKGAAIAEAKAPFSGQNFKSVQLAKSLNPQIDLALDAANAVSKSDIQSINRLKEKIGIEFGDKDWSALKDYTLAIADEFQAQIGAGSDAKLDLAVKMANSAKSADQLRTSLQIMRNISKSRAQALSGQQPTVESVTGKVSGDKGGNQFDDLYKQAGLK